MSVACSTVVSVRISNVSDHHLAHILKIQEIWDVEPSLHDVSLSHASSVCAWSRIYSLAHSHVTVSVRFRTGKNSTDMTGILTSTRRDFLQVLNNSGSAQVLAGSQVSDKISRQHVEEDIEGAQQRLLHRLMVWNDKAAIRDAKRVKLSIFANEFIRLMYRDSKLVDIMDELWNLSFLPRMTRTLRYLPPHSWSWYRIRWTLRSRKTEHTNSPRRDSRCKYDRRARGRSYLGGKP